MTRRRTYDPNPVFDLHVADGEWLIELGDRLVLRPVRLQSRGRQIDQDEHLRGRTAGRAVPTGTPYASLNSAVPGLSRRAPLGGNDVVSLNEVVMIDLGIVVDRTRRVRAGSGVFRVVIDPYIEQRSPCGELVSMELQMNHDRFRGRVRCGGANRLCAGVRAEGGG